MQVQELDLSGCSRLGSENFPLVALCCPNLQVLRLIGCCQVGISARSYNLFWAFVRIWVCVGVGVCGCGWWVVGVGGWEVG